MPAELLCLVHAFGWLAVLKIKPFSRSHPIFLPYLCGRALTRKNFTHMTSLGVTGSRYVSLGKMTSLLAPRYWTNCAAEPRRPFPLELLLCIQKLSYPHLAWRYRWMARDLAAYYGSTGHCNERRPLDGIGSL